MNKYTKAFYGVITLGLLLPSAASAAVFLRDEQALSLASPIADNLFATGETILIDQPVSGDIFAAGERVTITAPVTEDIFAAGGNIEITSPIDQDIFAAGNTITIEGSADDIFAAGNTITLRPTTTITGDAYLAGQTVTLAGTIKGDVRVAGQQVVIATGTTITGALISGGKRPLIEEGVSIGEQRHYEQPAAARRAPIGGLLVSVVTWFVTGLAARYLLPRTTAQLLTTPVEPVKTFFIGFGWLVFFVPVSIVLALSLIGLPLMFLVLLLTGLLVLGALTFTPIIIGVWAMRRITKRTPPLSWQDILLGSALYRLL